MTSGDLLEAFEAGRINNSDLPHERHVRVAWELAQRYPHDEALRTLIAGIQGIAERAGRPQAYHVTITRAWFELIAQATTLSDHPELFDKSLLARFYSSACLAGGRERWVEPDLHPLGLPAPAPAPASANLPDVLRAIPVAVGVVAAFADHTPHAATISSITSVSREPALMSVCLWNESRVLKTISAAQSFVISFLAAEQDDLAAHFGSAGRPSGAELFAGVPHHLSPFGPVIEGAAAWIGESVHAIHVCGDHHIVVGEVRAAEVVSGRRPLLRHDGSYH